MKNRSGTTAPSAPASPDLANLPLLHSRTLKVATRRPSGEQPSGWPDSIPGASCRDTYQEQTQKGGQ